MLHGGRATGGGCGAGGGSVGCVVAVGFQGNMGSSNLITSTLTRGRPRLCCAWSLICAMLRPQISAISTVVAGFVRFIELTDSGASCSRDSDRLRPQMLSSVESPIVATLTARLLGAAITRMLSETPLLVIIETNAPVDELQINRFPSSEPLRTKSLRGPTKAQSFKSRSKCK